MILFLLFKPYTPMNAKGEPSSGEENSREERRNMH